MANPVETLARITAAGFRVSQPREFEANTLYDTKDGALLHAGMLLRLRQAGDRGIVTWKGRAIPGPHKARPELETGVASVDLMAQILSQMGYEPVFRYEKYRTEFKSGHPGGVVVFDETPIGAFLELEGKGDWIDETAAELGFATQDYVLESYGSLYRNYCREKGMEPTNMVFPSS